MKATWNGAVLAQSNDTVEVEGNQYFPLDSVTEGVLVPSEKQTKCPWKGTAGYYDVQANGEINADAAWHYAEPKDAARQIKGHVAFWKGVQVEEN